MLSLQLVDFSLDGCMTRGTNALCQRMHMGDTGVAHLVIDNCSVDLECRLFRIEEESNGDESSGILLTFRFVDSHEERVDKLEQLLDEYAARW